MAGMVRDQDERAMRWQVLSADDREPVFSPDGSKIAFHSDRDGGGVYVMSALGGEFRPAIIWLKPATTGLSLLRLNFASIGHNSPV